MISTARSRSETLFLRRSLIDEFSSWSLRFTIFTMVMMLSQAGDQATVFHLGGDVPGEYVVGVERRMRVEKRFPCGLVGHGGDRLPWICASREHSSKPGLPKPAGGQFMGVRNPSVSHHWRCVVLNARNKTGIFGGR
jgi:hypothetical protein